MSDLHAACSRGNVEKVLELLRGGAKTSCVNVRMETPLHVACALSRDRAEEKMEIVKQLLLHDAPLQEEDERGRTPFMLAYETASADVAAALQDNGADLRACYHGDGTMLHPAVAGGNERVLSPACSGHLDIVRLLLEAGANPNVADTESGATPLMKAVSKGEEAYGQTSLYHAARFGRLDILRLLLEAGADGNAADSYGVTSLHIAACYRQLHIVRLLLEAGADPNVAETNRGETPLMRAVEEDREMMERILLSHGVDANTADSQGETSLYHAACSGQLDIVNLLLEAGADPNVADSYGRTTLYRASCFGRLDIVRLLLETGANPNVAETRNGATPLMMAVKDGEEAVVRMLLSHGADANAADSQGRNSLYYAAFSGWLDIVRLLLEAGADPTSLYHAACLVRMDIGRLLLEAGADPNVAKTNSRAMPLMMAVNKGDEAVVRMLLSHGADANAADSYGQTTLYQAACFDRLDIVRLLLEAGADPNVAQNMSEKMPLMMAVNKGKEAVVQMLLSHGADANAANSYGVTSLHVAVVSGRLDIMCMLLEAGADPNVAATEKVDGKSFTALHYSCDRLHIEMITHLLKHGANPNLVDCNKRTPLAIIGSKVEVRISRMTERAEQAESVVQAASALLQTCESAGVLLQVNTRDIDGDTPLHSFCRMMLAWRDDVYAREREGCVQIVHALLFNHGAHVDVVNARGKTPYKLWRRIYSKHFRLGNVESSNEIHGRMSAQYHSLKCHCARSIVRHSLAYENRLPTSLIEFVRAHARPT
ncbi:PREDICTED: ankyrin-1-like [Priapulus caudatus]|uniref:Ankyrin-1-like n=1 Tax=Priapulus caudatus TaxID=37621 RepID=A0ABM1EH10_PRICU|nr:PREDICTED: ankyrin-1-like [Priapulus caudatus]